MAPTRPSRSATTLAATSRASGRRSTPGSRRSCCATAGSTGPGRRTRADGGDRRHGPPAPLPGRRRRRGRALVHPRRRRRRRDRRRGRLRRDRHAQRRRRRPRAAARAGCPPLAERPARRSRRARARRSSRAWPPASSPSRSPRSSAAPSNARAKEALGWAPGAPDVARHTGDVIGRYAPSPTGTLHLGNLRTALLAWLFARSAGSRVPHARRGPRHRPRAARARRGSSSPTSRRSAWTGTRRS